MSLTVDIKDLRNPEGHHFNLTNQEHLENIIHGGFQLAHKDKVTSHPLVLYFSDFRNMFIDFKSEWDMEIPALVWNMFIPTSGWVEMDENYNYRANFRLREQQIDFLLSYFENWDNLPEHNMVIGFCDESPELTEIIEQVYDCINLYKIPKERIFFMGQNFLAQNDINKFAAERKEQPIKYIVRWHMTGHMDFGTIEDIAHRLPGHMVYNDQRINFGKKRYHKLSFLNRRPSMSRTAMLWGLWEKGVINTSTISAYPPLRYFGEAELDNSTADIINWEHMGHVLQKHQPGLLPGMNRETVEQFKKDMRVGKTIPGDHEHIGDTESQNIPSRNDFYVWVTCETVADMEKPNMFITEKVLKPVVNGHALILYSQRNFLQRFKKLGYKTLANHFGINEDYDSIKDDRLRMTAVLNEVERINNMSIDELHDCWQKAQADIKLNRQRIFLTLTNIRNNFTHNLVKNMVEELSEPHTRIEITNFDVNKELKKYKNFTDFRIFKDN